ncbi:MAG: sterol desaturase family protein, partial [Alphaproteobacteria bacterium]
HHRDRFLDVTSQMRFHFGEVLISAVVRAVVIVALAIPLEAVIVFEILLQLGTMFHHSNLRVAPRLERALARVVVTPSIHWVHHHRVRADTDSNYSTVFAWWDRLFASRSPTARTPAMDIGVEGRPELPLLGLLLLPFKGSDPFIPKRGLTPISRKGV